MCKRIQKILIRLKRLKCKIYYKFLSSSKFGFFGRDTDLSRVSHEKEMSDLEKMGVLRWSDSEGSDAEDDLMK